MRALAPALAVFLLALAAQVVVWRCRRPRGQYATLLGLYLGILLVAVAAFSTARPMAPALSGVLPVTRFDYANFVVLYVALLLAYATTYSAVQADSPTMSILIRIEAAGAQGVSRADLLAGLTDELLVTPRLDDLVTGGLASRRAGRYVIAPRGALFAWAVASYRRLLGMERGG